MVDTLFVVTNALPDTLRIILNSADKQSSWAQHSPLLIAFGVVIIASIAQIVVAIIYKKQYEKNRKIEKMKIKSDLIFKNKQNWVSEFRTIIYNLLKLINKILLKTDGDIELTKDKREKLFQYESNLRLYLDYRNPNHDALIDVITSIKEGKSWVITRQFMINYYVKITTYSQDIINEIIDETEKL